MAKTAATANIATDSHISFDKLLVRLQADNPATKFAAGDAFCWSPVSGQVVYKRQAKGLAACYSLLHELAHAKLGHKRYQLDFELLELEVAAWEEAKLLAGKYGLSIDEDHIQNCLDTYRDWLFRRSICPTCGTKTIQQDNGPLYRCFNCHASWRVAPSRFCRPYRKSQDEQSALVFAAEL